MSQHEDFLYQDRAAAGYQRSPPEWLSDRFFVIPLSIALALVISSCAPPEEPGKHLFILSGQSNMAGMNPDEAFTPAIEAEFGEDNVIVVKHAVGGQPIRRWFKLWKPAEGDEPNATGDLYDSLMTRVNLALIDTKIESLTFVWMQGERDAREEHGQVYEASLNGLLGQLQTDLSREDINFVVGRLSDFDMDNARYPHWTMVREAQVQFTEAHTTRSWVDTDDLNDGFNRQGREITNDLHYSVEGYKVLGQRFAAESISLVNKSGGASRSADRE